MRLRLYRYAADRQIAYKPKMMFALRECKREASALDKVRIDRNASAISMWLRSFSESRQIAQMIIASKPTPMRFNRSFYSVSREMGGYPLRIAQATATAMPTTPFVTSSPLRAMHALESTLRRRRFASASDKNAAKMSLRRATDRRPAFR